MIYYDCVIAQEFCKRRSCLTEFWSDNTKRYDTTLQEESRSRSVRCRSGDIRESKILRPTYLLMLAVLQIRRIVHSTRKLTSLRVTALWMRCVYLSDYIHSSLPRGIFFPFCTKYIRYQSSRLFFCLLLFQFIIC